MDTSVEAPAAATHLAPFQVGLDFEMSVKTWADSAIAILETTTEERQRIAVRDEAVRVVALAEAAGAGVSVALANEILQRAIRKIGKGSPRRRAGRPAQAAGDDVRGDMIPASELPGGGHRRARPEQNRSPRGTNSRDGSTAAAGDLPKATRSAYRKDAEEISDEGFERIGSSVRAAAEAAPAAGHKLDRATVRAAGAVEAAGGDPGDLQAVTAKRRVLSDSRKRSPSQGDDDSSPAWCVPPRIVDVARKLLGGAIDLDPASSEAANRHARAKVFYDGADASHPGLKAAWPKDAKVWLHPPHGAELVARFVERALAHAESGAPMVVLTDNRTQMPWAQSLLKAAHGVCFINGDVTFLRPRSNDPTVLEEAPSASPHGQILVGLNVNRTTFEQLCAPLGACFVRGADEDADVGFLSLLRFGPKGSISPPRLQERG